MLEKNKKNCSNDLHVFHSYWISSNIKPDFPSVLHNTSNHCKKKNPRLQ
jgi:hypothetical protein